MKEIARLTGVEWRETIGHTRNLELPLYVNRPLPNQPVRYDPDRQEAVDYVKTKPRSPIGEGKESEGLVGIPCARLTDFRGNRVIVKIKSCDF